MPSFQCSVYRRVAMTVPVCLKLLMKKCCLAIMWMVLLLFKAFSSLFAQTLQHQNLHLMLRLIRFHRKRVAAFSFQLFFCFQKNVSFRPNGAPVNGLATHRCILLHQHTWAPFVAS